MPTLQSGGIRTHLNGISVSFVASIAGSNPFAFQASSLQQVPPLHGPAWRTFSTCRVGTHADMSLSTGEPCVPKSRDAARRERAKSVRHEPQIRDGPMAPRAGVAPISRRRRTVLGVRGADL